MRPRREGKARQGSGEADGGTVDGSRQRQGSLGGVGCLELMAQQPRLARGEVKEGTVSKTKQVGERDKIARLIRGPGR